MTNLQKIQSERILKSYGVSPIQKDIDLNIIAEKCNDSFNKGIITENEFNSAIDYFEDLMKARNVKYFKREGTAGNYKYYYSEAEYKQKKGLESKKEEDGGIKMNNLDWGSSTAERNENLDKFNSLKTKEEKESFKKELKAKNESGDKKDGLTPEEKKKVDTARKYAVGYLGGKDVADKMTDREVLDKINKKDSEAKEYNSNKDKKEQPKESSNSQKSLEEKERELDKQMSHFRLIGMVDKSGNIDKEALERTFRFNRPLYAKNIDDLNKFEALKKEVQKLNQEEYSKRLEASKESSGSAKRDKFEESQKLTPEEEKFYAENKKKVLDLMEDDILMTKKQALGIAMKDGGKDSAKKGKKVDVVAINDKIYDILQKEGVKDIRMEADDISYGDNTEVNINITGGGKKMEGMSIIFDGETYEVSEEQTGVSGDDRLIFGNFKTLDTAVRQALRGNSSERGIKKDSESKKNSVKKEKLTKKEFNDKKGNIKKSESTDPYDILKSDITYSLGNFSNPIEFSKKGSEIKDMVKTKLPVLQGKLQQCELECDLIKEQAKEKGIEVDKIYSEFESRGYAYLDESTPNIDSSDNLQLKLINLLYKKKDLKSDISTLEIVLDGIEDNKSYKLNINQIKSLKND